MPLGGWVPGSMVISINQDQIAVVMFSVEISPLSVFVACRLRTVNWIIMTVTIYQNIYECILKMLMFVLTIPYMLIMMFINLQDLFTSMGSISGSCLSSICEVVLPSYLKTLSCSLAQLGQFKYIHRSNFVVSIEYLFVDKNQVWQSYINIIYLSFHFNFTFRSYHRYERVTYWHHQFIIIKWILHSHPRDQYQTNR